jgi:nucleotide-binding universal stress UspA family protein
MVTKILIPTDFSRNAWHALCYTLELYRHSSCEIHLLNAFSIADGLSVLMYPEPGDEEYENAKLESEQELSKLADKITIRLQGFKPHKIQIAAICGEPLEVIKDYSQTNQIELIVMGTQGVSDTGKAVFGSVAVSVMEKVRNCPVMVVPQSTLLASPKEVVFPTKLSSNFTETNLKVLNEILLTHQSHLKILHIFKNTTNVLSKAQNEVLNRLKRLLPQQLFSFKALHNLDVLSGINCFIESRESDMVTFLNKKHAFFGSILTRPLIKQITFYTRVPVLVLHE